MTPLRLTVTFPLADPVEDLGPALDVFHRFIQRGLAEGQLLDVADYRHVPSGPGVLLIGHDIDYGLTGDALTLTRKRKDDESAASQLRDLLRMGLGIAEAITADGELTAVVDPAAVEVAVLDRRLGDPAAVAAGLADELSPVIGELFSPDARVAVAESPDARRPAALTVSAPTADLAEVLAKLGGSQAPGQSPWDIAVEELVRLREADADFVLLDVREPNEYETVNLGGTLIPLAELPDRLDELDRAAHVVTHCRAGSRGAKAVTQLREAGFANAWNVNGGLMAWIDRVDPSLPRY